MKDDPENHDRKSLRLKGYDYTAAGLYFITICTYQRHCLFGTIVDGEMQLNAVGQMVNACWQRLPFHRSNLALDAFVVMPNHVHGILVLADSPGRGAALGQRLELFTEDSFPNAAPSNAAEVGVAFGWEMVESCENQLPHTAPLPVRLMAGSMGAIVLNFKSVTTRSRNQRQRSPGALLWQRNYYEHIVCNKMSLQHLRQYIHNNPFSWQEDQLHPDHPSKW